MTDQIYIGSTTTTLSTRMAQHRHDLKKAKEGVVKYLSSIPLLEAYPDCQIILIESYPCHSKEELRARERHHIELNRDICVNIALPGRTREEWFRDNKEWLASRAKEYYSQHRDEILVDRKQYYEQNKEGILERGRLYRVAHAEHIAERKKLHYEENKEMILARAGQYRANNNDKIKAHSNERVTCECGALINRSNVAKHRRTAKHAKNMS